MPVASMAVQSVGTGQTSWLQTNPSQPRRKKVQALCLASASRNNQLLIYHRSHS